MKNTYFKNFFDIISTTSSRNNYTLLYACKKSLFIIPFLLVLLCLTVTNSFSQIKISSNTFYYHQNDRATITIGGIDEPIKSPNTCLKVNDIRSTLIDSNGIETIPDSSRLISSGNYYSLMVYVKFKANQVFGNYRVKVQTPSSANCTFVTTNFISVVPLTQTGPAEVSMYQVLEFTNSNNFVSATFSGKNVDFKDSSSCFKASVSNVFLKNQRSGFILAPSSISAITSNKFTAYFKLAPTTDTGSYKLSYSGNCKFINNTLIIIFHPYVYNSLNYVQLYKENMNIIYTSVKGAVSCKSSNAYLQHVFEAYKIPLPNFTPGVNYQNLFIPSEAPVGKYKLVLDNSCLLESKAIFEVKDITMSWASGILYPGVKSSVSYNTSYPLLKDTSCLTAGVNVIKLQNLKTGATYYPATVNVKEDYLNFILPTDADTGNYKIVFGAGKKCETSFNSVRVNFPIIQGGSNSEYRGKLTTISYTSSGINFSDVNSCYYANVDNTYLKEIKTGFTVIPTSVTHSNYYLYLQILFPSNAPTGTYKLVVNNKNECQRYISNDSVVVNKEGFIISTSSNKFETSPPFTAIEVIQAGVNGKDSSSCYFPSTDRFKLYNLSSGKTLSPYKISSYYGSHYIYFKTDYATELGDYRLITAVGTSCIDTLKKIITFISPTIQLNSVPAKIYNGSRLAISGRGIGVNFLKENYLPKPSVENFFLINDSLKYSLAADSLVWQDSITFKAWFPMPCAAPAGNYYLHVRKAAVDIKSQKFIVVNIPDANNKIDGDLVSHNGNMRFNYKGYPRGSSVTVELGKDGNAFVDPASLYKIPIDGLKMQSLINGPEIILNIYNYYHTPTYGFSSFKFYIPLNTPVGDYLIYSNANKDCASNILDTIKVAYVLQYIDTMPNYAGQSYTKSMENYYSRSSVINYNDVSSAYYYKNLSGFITSNNSSYKFPIAITLDSSRYTSDTLYNYRIRFNYQVPCDAPEGYYSIQLKNKFNSDIVINTSFFNIYHPHVYLNNETFSNQSEPLAPGTRSTVSIYGTGTRFLSRSGKYYLDSAGLIFRHQSYQYKIIPDQVSVMSDNYMQAHLSIPKDAPSGTYKAEMGSGFCKIFSQEDPAVYDKGKNLNMQFFVTGRIRRGFPLNEYLVVSNFGSEKVSGANIKFLIAAGTTHSLNTSYSQVADTLIIPVPELLPGESKTFPVPSFLPLNFMEASLPYYAAVFLSDDIFPNDNYVKGILRTVNSFDPNEKRVIPDAITPSQVKQGVRLNYTIFFQNIGTDTAFDVVIHDTLDQRLNLLTFKNIVSSHSYQTEVNDNIVTWKFHNIFLPHKAINDSASQGFIQFSIEPKKELLHIGFIKNQANIYFDDNEGIITNVVSTNITEYPETVAEQDSQVMDLLNIFPNPNDGIFTISTSSSIQSFQIWNSLGKEVYRSSVPPLGNVVEVQLPDVKGMYLLLTDDGGKQKTKKFFIK